MELKKILLILKILVPGSPGADFGTASESKIYTLEQLHSIREAEIEQAVLALKLRKRRQMEEEYDNEITNEQQVHIDALRMATTGVRRKMKIYVKILHQLLTFLV